MMFRLLFLSSLIVLTNSKTIFPWNLTTTIMSTLQSTSTTTSSTLQMLTSTILNSPTTTPEYVEQTTTAATVKDKPFKHQWDLSLNNDSVYLSVHSNATNKFVSINNTFTMKSHNDNPCGIIFNEHTAHSNSKTTTILIHFNGTFTRDLAIQLGDRLIDTADLLLQIQTLDHQNHTDIV